MPLLRFLGPLNVTAVLTWTDWAVLVCAMAFVSLVMILVMDARPRR